jgi:hypothetical protein
MSGSDLLSPIEAIEHETARFLNVGWRDGPNGDSSLSERLERWARTVWPLFRFRELARAALVDRVREGGFAVEDSTPPGDLATPRAYFDFVHGPRGAQVDAKYRAWRADRTFASYLAFMTARDPEYLRGVRDRVRNYIPLDEESPTRRSLDALLGRIAGGHFRSTIVLMPENPVLELDRQGLYHDAELEDRAVATLLREAERFGIPVVDGRRWKPAEDFSDFDHLMIGVAGFETLLAREIARALAG